MGRDIDERKKRKALRKLRKAAALAEQGLGPPLSDWEKQILEEVEERIEKFGSAFHDLDKGGSDEALSALQQVKLREIDKKARGKGKGGFKSKGGFGRKSAPKSNPRVRQIDEDLEQEPPPPGEARPAKPQLVPARALKPADPPSISAQATPKRRPQLRVIDGGADKD